MASLVLNVAATYFTGGSSIWLQIGAHLAASYVGSAIDQKLFGTTQHGYGPTLAQQNVQASTLGQMKPLVKGSARLSGNMIWSTPYIQTATTVNVANGGGGGGGKGGGGGSSTSTTYTYSQSLAVALGDMPIVGIRRIWATGRLIYDAGSDSPSAIAASNAAQTAFTIYTGTETQTPNSFIQAYMASAQNQYYFLCTPMSTADMQVTVGAGVLKVGTGLVRTMPQVVTLAPWAWYLPNVEGRIDRVVINQTTGVASVLTGVVSSPPYPPAIPAGYIPACRVRFDQMPNPALAPYITQIAAATSSQITNEGPAGWAPSIAYGYDPTNFAGSFVYASGNLYMCVVGGISGPVAPSGTGSVSDGACTWQYVGTAQTAPPVPTPAYRGTPYIVFYNFQLAQTGNTTPNFEFEVVEGTTDLGQIVTYFAGLASLLPSQLDVTHLTGTTVGGILITSQSSARSVMQPLASAFFFDAVESDGLVKFVKRGGSSAVTIPENDMAARGNGVALPENLTIVRKPELELPRTLTLSYPDIDNSFLVGSKYHRMQSTQSILAATLQIPVSMHASDAQDIVAKLLNIAWNERTTFSFTASKKYCKYEPTDIVVLEKGTGIYEARLTSKDESAPGIVTFTAVMEDVGLYSNKLNNILDGIKIPALFNTPPGSIIAPLIMDAPGIRTASGFELWIAAGSSNKNWGGCGVFVSTDNVNFSQVGLMHGSSVYGAGTLALGTGADLVNPATILISPNGVTLNSFPNSDMNNHASLCYLDGEMISYNDAALVALNKYNLGYSASVSGGEILRGVFNTPPAAHASAPFAFIDARVFKYAYDPKMVGQILYFKFPSFNVYGGSGEDVSTVPTYTHLIAGSIGFPSNVTGFAASQNGNVVVFQWNASPDPLGYSAGFEFRYGPVGGSTWASAIPITIATKGSQITTAKIPPGTWELFACEIDISHKYSTIPAASIITVVNSNIVIYSADEAPTWLGASTNLVRHWTGVVYADSQTLANATGNMSGLASTLALFNTFCVNPQLTATYTSPVINTIFDSNDRVWSAVSGEVPPTALRTEFDPSIQIRTSTLLGSWSAWQPWTIGTIDSTYYQFLLTLDATDGDTPVVTSCALTVDAPLLQLGSNALTVAPGGITVTFANRYHNIPVVTAIAVSATPLVAVVTNVTPTSFDVSVFNYADVNVGGTINWTSSGG